MINEWIGGDVCCTQALISIMAVTTHTNCPDFSFEMFQVQLFNLKFNGHVHRAPKLYAISITSED